MQDTAVADALTPPLVSAVVAALSDPQLNQETLEELPNVVRDRRAAEQQSQTPAAPAVSPGTRPRPGTPASTSSQSEGSPLFFGYSSDDGSTSVPVSPVNSSPLKVNLDQILPKSPQVAELLSEVPGSTVYDLVLASARVSNRKTPSRLADVRSPPGAPPPSPASPLSARTEKTREDLKELVNSPIVTEALTTPRQEVLDPSDLVEESLDYALENPDSPTLNVNPQEIRKLQDAIEETNEATQDRVEALEDRVLPSLAEEFLRLAQQARDSYLQGFGVADTDQKQKEFNLSAGVKDMIRNQTQEIRAAAEDVLNARQNNDPQEAPKNPQSKELGKQILDRLAQTEGAFDKDDELFMYETVLRDVKDLDSARLKLDDLIQSDPEILGLLNERVTDPSVTQRDLDQLFARFQQLVRRRIFMRFFVDAPRSLRLHVASRFPTQQQLPYPNGTMDLLLWRPSAGISQNEEDGTLSAVFYNDYLTFIWRTFDHLYNYQLRLNLLQSSQTMLSTYVELRDVALPPFADLFEELGGATSSSTGTGSVAEDPQQQQSRPYIVLTENENTARLREQVRQLEEEIEVIQVNSDRIKQLLIEVSVQIQTGVRFYEPQTAVLPSPQQQQLFLLPQLVRLVSSVYERLFEDKELFKLRFPASVVDAVTAPDGARSLERVQRLTSASEEFSVQKDVSDTLQSQSDVLLPFVGFASGRSLSACIPLQGGDSYGDLGYASPSFEGGLRSASEPLPRPSPSTTTTTSARRQTPRSSLRSSTTKTVVTSLGEKVTRNDVEGLFRRDPELQSLTKQRKIKRVSRNNTIRRKEALENMTEEERRERDKPRRGSRGRTVEEYEKLIQDYADAIRDYDEQIKARKNFLLQLAFSEQDPEKIEALRKLLRVTHVYVFDKSGGQSSAATPAPSAEETRQQELILAPENPLLYEELSDFASQPRADQYLTASPILAGGAVTPFATTTSSTATTIARTSSSQMIESFDDIMDQVMGQFGADFDIEEILKQQEESIQKSRSDSFEGFQTQQQQQQRQSSRISKSVADSIRQRRIAQELSSDSSSSSSSIEEEEVEEEEDTRPTKTRVVYLDELLKERNCLGRERVLYDNYFAPVPRYMSREFQDVIKQLHKDALLEARRRHPSTEAVLTDEAIDKIAEFHAQQNNTYYREVLRHSLVEMRKQIIEREVDPQLVLVSKKYLESLLGDNQNVYANHEERYKKLIASLGIRR